MLLQWTWGILQTIVGFVLFCTKICERHTLFHGAVATYWNRPFGISLGAFIFIPPKARFYNSEKYHFSDAEIQERLTVHEYGHTIQSLILGPFYFLIVGIPSVIWEMMKPSKCSYFSFYTEKEKWANHFGEICTGEKSMETIDYISAELWTDKELAIIETNETIMCSRKTVSTHLRRENCI